MNKINELPSEIPDTTHRFQIDLVGAVTKTRFLGEFVCKIPTIKDQAQIAKYEAFLNGEFPAYLNQGVLNVHKWIAYTKFTLVDVPLFWRESELGYNLRDPNVIEAIYDEVLIFEQKWYDQIWGIGKEDGSNEEKEG